MNLSEQVGPLPLGAWIGVVAGGIGIGYLGRRKRTAATGGGQAAPVPADTAPWQSSQGAVSYAGPGTGVTTMGTPKYATNEEWAAAAAAYLIGRGALGSRATNALSHVLYPDPSHPTTSDDSALYNAAAAGIGLPPSLPSQAYIPDPPGVNRPTTPTGVSERRVIYDSSGVATGTADVYTAGPWSVRTRDLSPSGDTTGLGFVDRAGNIYGYYLDAAHQATSAFVRLASGQIVQATPQQIADANAAGIGAA